MNQFKNKNLIAMNHLYPQKIRSDRSITNQSSIESLLESRRENPEQLLWSLGFGDTPESCNRFDPFNQEEEMLRKNRLMRYFSKHWTNHLDRPQQYQNRDQNLDRNRFQFSNSTSFSNDDDDDEETNTVFYVDDADNYNTITNIDNIMMMMDSKRIGFRRRKTFRNLEFNTENEYDKKEEVESEDEDEHLYHLRVFELIPNRFFSQPSNAKGIRRNFCSRRGL
ncbi:hypothetical protein SSS_00058 [Sarcoptes scabiei]|uniref:Uncharacterized protein n=1 Tax=Sarcoptes scabiei TaxID=52283 RepID=A0A834VC57_SARSC|nr:hypothetical protein SSS_00058 [Sarcoptes scabiei]